MFHYGWFSSVVFFTYMIIEYIISPFSFPNGMRFVNYNWEQWKLLLLMAVLNTLEMNLATLAYQYDNVGFIALLEMS